MQRIDEAAIHEFGIPRLLLMEHAGFAVAQAVQALVSDRARSVLFCCGTGYNGGDGLCAARHLLQWGYQPRVLLAGSVSSLREEPGIYVNILHHLQVPVIEVQSSQDVEAQQLVWQEAGVMVDALVGIGLRGPVRPVIAEIIARINQAGGPVVAVDVPSGLDADTGLPQGIAVRATTTVTFGLPKQGFVTADGPRYTGRVVVAEISLPPQLLAVS